MVDLEKRRVLIANFLGSDQEKDLTVPPNCRGFGRIRHFRRRCNERWVDDPLPIDPARKALGLPFADTMRAQVFQLAGCNFRCWYCFVPNSLLDADTNASRMLSPGDLVELYLDQKDPPAVIDLSGGQPDLAPEWVPWMMRKLSERVLDKEVYLWADDNLSTDYFWRFLSETEREFVASYPNYGKVCCFKGFDSSSFAFNTRADAALFDRQFELMDRLMSTGIDLFAYVTLTTHVSSGIEERVGRFVDRLQSLHENLPLRTVPLEIQVYSPVKVRMDEFCEKALKNQYIAVDAWRKELEKRFTAQQRSRNIADVPLRISRL
jgi:uncharacterized Fe-S cluster-containing radical SAM superfamily protein